MRASWIAVLMLSGLPWTNSVFGADDPAPEEVTAEYKVVRLPIAVAREFRAGHNLDADPAGGWATLQTLLQAGKAELAVDLKVTAKTHERATNEQGSAKMVVDSTPASIPGGMMTDIQVSFENHTITTHSSWKAHAERFLGFYDSDSKEALFSCVGFLRLYRK